MFGDTEYTLVAVKRPWVPDWLWRAAGHRLPVYQPFRWILTTPVEAADQQSNHRGAAATASGESGGSPPKTIGDVQ